MKISINWLKDFVDLSGITNQELIKRLTLSTAEIEKVVDYGKIQIMSCKIKRTSTKLKKMRVKVDEVTIYDVICGAPNCREGISFC